MGYVTSINSRTNITNLHFTLPKLEKNELFSYLIYYTLRVIFWYYEKSEETACKQSVF